MSRNAAVVGGGWSGIAAAWYLHRAGYAVTVYDQGEGLGGRSASARLGNRKVTLGGKNIGARYTEFRKFVGALDAGYFEYFGINSSRVENGRIRTIDGREVLRSAFSYLRGAPLADTLRFLRLVRLVRHSDDNRFLEAPGFMAYARRNGDVPLDRVFGKYLSSQLIRMMTVRMNAAEPDEVFIANFGTNLGMLLDHFDQLSAGFDPVFERFSGLVSVKLRTRVEQIITEGSMVTGVGTETAGGKTAECPADIVVVALPSWDAATLVEPLSASLAGDLREIRYFPLAVAIVEYGSPVFTEQMRALTFPKASILSNAGAYGTNDRNIVRYTFSGAGARDFLKQHHDSDALIRSGEQELELHISLAGNARKNFVTAQWKHGLCAYAAGHHDRLLQIATESARWPNLLLAGDYVKGASIEACFRGAQAVTAPLSEAPDQH